MKLFEKIICGKLELFLSSLVHPPQHSFEKQRSTATNLFVYVSHLFEQMSGAKDLAKAFDRVNHRLLLRKLQLMGVDACALDWLNSYLSGRTQTVCVGSETSRPIHTCSGVPQGSRIGPLLFSIFINDLTHKLSGCYFLLYADDPKIY